MRLGPVARAAAGGLARRRVQTIVIGLVLLVSTGACVLALALVADSSTPFDHAFAAQRGAHVIAVVDPARATAAQLAATGRLAEVTAAAGPFGEVTVNPKQSGPGGGLPWGTMLVAGRASPGGPVDDLTLQSGHWADGPGQLVLASDPSPGNGVSVPLGTQLTMPGAAGKVTLTVVGIADSVDSSAGGWVLPGEIAKLMAPGTTPAAQMQYRFRDAGTATAIRADFAAVTAALPAGAVTGSESYLAIKAQEASNIAPFVPFVVAFAILGLALSALIVANVVSAAVVAGYHRIGVLKSIGFTPGQVLGAYTGQAMVPAIAGCLAGVVLGNLLAVPVLGHTANVYGVGALRVPTWVDVAVPVAMCCLTGISALLPALRAGRFSAAQAITAGRAPRTGRGYAAHRLLGSLALPRPVTIGLAAPFARPARTAITMTAVVLGATAVTFAVGLGASLTRVVNGVDHASAEPVQVFVPIGGPGGIRVFRGGGAVHVRASRRGGQGAAPPGPGKPPTPAQVERYVTAALRAQPGTLRYVAQTDQQVSVAGLSQQADVTAFDGDAAWTGYAMISGHWYTGPGQAVVGAGFLTDTGKSVGDTVTLVSGSRLVPVKIVGEAFDTQNNGLAMVTDWQTLARVMPGQAPSMYDVALRPGTSAAAYTQALQQRLGPAYMVMPNNHNKGLPIILGLIGTLTLLLAIVAGLGVLNTVVLYTTERVHDLGVFKAIGMTPRQTIAMVICWVAGTGLVAGLIAVPAGIAVHHHVLPAMAAAANVGLPASFLNVYGGWQIAALALAGLVIAVAGALLPAGWAAGTRTATVLRAE
ncbi:MAG TPA: FtsX-like permease family protein [Streptosporangiaceae bacterium]|nr:FtsX-like permease family protein [Streptosporangiaceae bacterium]